MKGIPLAGLTLVILTLGGCVGTDETASPAPEGLETSSIRIELPLPAGESDVSLEESLVRRRSVRDYTDEPLTLAEVSQLLWAAQGVTGERGGRTAPSAGALYPLEVHLVAGEVVDLQPGVYRYAPADHELIGVLEGDLRADLARLVATDRPVQEAPATIVLTAIYSRTTRKYGDRGIRYVHLEAGHAAQNVYLQAAAMNLGTVTLGAFDDDELAATLKLPKHEEPLCVMPVGRQ